MNTAHARSGGRTPDEVTQDGWLHLMRSGMSIREIAREVGATSRKIEAGVGAALRREGPAPVVKERTYWPRLVLSFGAGCKAKPTCADIHPGGPIPSGSLLCCACCHQSGVDHLPIFRITPGELPAAETESDTPAGSVGGRRGKPPGPKRKVA